MDISFFIDVNKPFFEGLIQHAKDFYDSKIYYTEDAQSPSIRKKREQEAENRRINFIKNIKSAQRIVYPSLHQKWIAEIREKYGIPT